MDAVSSVASIIAVIQLTGSIVKLCGGYIRAVKDAREEILDLQRAITGLQGTIQNLQKFLQSNNGKVLPTSSRLVTNITDCLSDLQALKARLDAGNGKRLMRKVGLRALKWPLKRTEVEVVVKNLERYKTAFLLSLQVDQTSLVADMVRNTDHIDQHIVLGKLEGAMEAGFESFSDQDEVQCLPGTRTELLLKVMEWAISPSQKSIFWLKGMAGTGKSTISRTVARSLKDTNHLGASFFFKRGEGDRGNAKKFFPTLTRQLMLWSSELRFGVQKALDDDPDIASKSLREQFEKLLLQPLLSLNQPGPQPQITVMVIDALDELQLWDAATGDLQQTLEGHSGWVNSVAFSPDGRLLAAGLFDDSTVRLWDLATGDLQQTLQCHSGSVLSVAFSPDGRLLVSGSDDCTVCLWDPTTGDLQQTLRGHSGSVNSVALSPDGQLLASGSSDRTVRLWDSATGALQETLRTEMSATELKFSLDGSTLSTNLGLLRIQRIMAPS
ncbi:hypothetical protein KXV29_002655 [Aspergillus fumigatus]|nr:hypothetical protein KXV29_002655 [Aspergillus fumigatus]KAJ8240882.1 hypothetical protein LV156_001437 [Aspergillus fumigatus]